MAVSSEDIVEFAKYAASPGAIVVLGWWLRGQFSSVAEAARLMLVLHEKQDERRHQQNLVRFAKINAKLGIGDIIADDDMELGA